jgi:hypothetical protein
MLKGALHVHSTYSDGQFTLDELRRVYGAEGCSFVCITDHAESFDSQSIHSYAEHLQRLSDSKFCFVPGLEYRCDRDMHILGYGAHVLAATANPEEIIRHIDSQSSIAVIAHPKNDFFSWIEEFKVLPQGIETWNSKYDGRYAPRPGTFALLQRLRKRAPEMHAFYGQDLHWKTQFRGLCVSVDCVAPDPPSILAALAAGNFRAQKDELELPSSGILPETMLEEFALTNARSHRMRQFLKSSRQTLDRLGIRVPESLKAQLRRIF